VSGDGRPDLLVGAPFTDINGRQGSGSAYVLSGVAPGADVDLAAHGRQLLRIDGAAALDLTGGSVAAAGDVNGDERADAILGAAGADANGRRDSGSAYVVSPGGPSSTVDLTALAPAQGFRIGGAEAEDAAGTVVAGPGDVNGDGRADVLVGAPFADPAGRSNAGAAYIAYGFGAPALRYRTLRATVGHRVRRHAPAVVRRTGPGRFTVSPALPHGLRLDPATGVVTGTPAVYRRTARYAVTMTDLTGSVRAALVITVADRELPRLRLSVPSVQHVLRQHAVIVRASCDEPCRLRASGTVSVAGTGVVATLQTIRQTLPSRDAKTLRLPLSGSAQRRLTAALQQGRLTRAVVTVRAVDRAGNASSATRTIALRG
jgi:FG-GAP repeat/Putative Ig domain